MQQQKKKDNEIEQIHIATKWMKWNKIEYNEIRWTELVDWELNYSA